MGIVRGCRNNPEQQPIPVGQNLNLGCKHAVIHSRAVGQDDQGSIGGTGQPVAKLTARSGQGVFS